MEDEGDGGLRKRKEGIEGKWREGGIGGRRKKEGGRGSWTE